MSSNEKSTLRILKASAVMWALYWTVCEKEAELEGKAFVLPVDPTLCNVDKPLVVTERMRLWICG